MKTNTLDFDEPLWTIEQAGRVLRRHPALIRRWVADDLIPTVRATTGHRRHLLTYEAMKLIEAMPRARGTKTVQRQTTLTRQSTGETQTLTYTVEEEPA